MRIIRCILAGVLLKLRVSWKHIHEIWFVSLLSRWPFSRFVIVTIEMPHIIMIRLHSEPEINETSESILWSRSWKLHVKYFNRRIQTNTYRHILHGWMNERRLELSIIFRAKPMLLSFMFHTLKTIDTFSMRWARKHFSFIILVKFRASILQPTIHR